MANSTLRLTGMNAVLVLIALTGLVGFRWVNTAQALSGEGHALLENWVQLEFQRELLDNPTLDSAKLGDAVSRAGTIRIASIDAHGSPDDLAVRVRLEPNPIIPPSAEMTRYYSIGHSPITGWSTPGRRSALGYYLNLF